MRKKLLIALLCLTPLGLLACGEKEEKPQVTSNKQEIKKEDKKALSKEESREKFFNEWFLSSLNYNSDSLEKALKEKNVKYEIDIQDDVIKILEPSGSVSDIIIVAYSNGIENKPNAVTYGHIEGGKKKMGLVGNTDFGVKFLIGDSDDNPTPVSSVDKVAEYLFK